MKLLIKLCYDGSAYSGFQFQKNARSVQEELNKAARSLFGFDCDVCGCSRTDAGVHARCFCATLEPRNGGDTISLPAERVPEAMNFWLPEDIAVFDAEYKPDDFHARYSVKSKTYEYHILNSKYRNPLKAGRVFMPRRFLSGQDVERMRTAAGYIAGRRDFRSFMSSGSSVTDTVREVTELRVTEKDGEIVISISADGFLYNMVRIIAGTLFAVGCGRISPEEIPGIITALDRTKAAETLPPEGLYLCEVRY